MQTKGFLRRRWWVILPLFLIIGAMSWLLWPDIPDPRYDGERLSTYVARLPNTPYAENSEHKRIHFSETGIMIIHGSPKLITNGLTQAAIDNFMNREASRAEFEKNTRAAIRAMGQDCFPLLLFYLGKEETKLDRLIRKLPFTVRAWLVRLRVKTVSNSTPEKRRSAAVALQELHRSGIDMTPTILPLAELAKSSEFDVKRVAKFLLKEIDGKTWWELEMGQSITNYFPNRNEEPSQNTLKQ